VWRRKVERMRNIQCRECAGSKRVLERVPMRVRWADAGAPHPLWSSQRFERRAGVPITLVEGGVSAAAPPVTGRCTSRGEMVDSSFLRIGDVLAR